MVALTTSLWAAIAWAQPGVVIFRNGARFEGEIVSNQPGQPVTVRMPDGTLAAYAAQDVASVELTAPPPAPPPPIAATPLLAAPPSAQPAAYDPAVQQLLEEKHALRQKRVGIGGPIAFMAAGAGIMVAGGATYAVGVNQCIYYYDGSSGYDKCGEWNGTMTAGVIFMSVGGAMLLTGVALLPGRLIRRAKRNRRMHEIDQELAQRGVHASLSPLVPMREGQPYGLVLRASF